jgi:L-aspartate oxidase
VGECAATGAHGANRLASNSLLEAAVMAHRAAAAVAGAPGWPAGPSAPPAPLALGGADVRATVQAAMWTGAGLERDAAGLEAARAVLDALPAAADPEGANLAHVARLVVRAAALRVESRGAHARRDHPSADPAWARRIAWVGDRPILLSIDQGGRAAREAA